MSPPHTAVHQGYLYGLVPAEALIPAGMVGVGGAAVEAVPLGALQLVVSAVEPERFGLAADLVAHSTVLDGIAESADVVPVAVGTFVPLPPDDVAVDRLTAAYEQARPRIAGAVQYALTVRYVEEVALAELVHEDREVARLRERTRGNPGLRAEAMELGERIVTGLQRKAAAEATGVLDALPPVRELRRRPAEQPDTVVEATMLVDRAAAAGLERALEGLAARHADRMRFRLLGPQAPYEFVTGG